MTGGVGLVSVLALGGIVLILVGGFFLRPDDRERETRQSHRDLLRELARYEREQERRRRVDRCD